MIYQAEKRNQGGSELAKSLPALLNQRLPGLSAAGDKIINLGGPAKGLRLSCWHNTDNQHVITLDGLEEHRYAGKSCERDLIQGLNQIVSPETLIEVRASSRDDLNQLINALPAPFTFINDEESSVYQTKGLGWLADYFDREDKVARLLRCYQNTAELFADPIGATIVLSALVDKTDLYFAMPIAKACWWIEQTHRPGGIGGDLRRWI